MGVPDIAYGTNITPYSLREYRTWVLTLAPAYDMGVPYMAYGGRRELHCKLKYKKPHSWHLDAAFDVDEQRRGLHVTVDQVPA
eukprot:2734880-Rhodomonas_salina.2